LLTARQAPNLSRTLQMMEGYGLPAIEKNARETQPAALATEFLVVLDSPPTTFMPSQIVQKLRPRLNARDQ
jgi:predicted transcriptional regulator